MSTPSAAQPAILAPGSNLVAGYTVVALVSRGEALDVYDVWSEQRACRCVAKVMRPDRRAERRVRARLLEEGRLLQQLAHPHLVRAYDVVRLPDPVVVLEPLVGPTVADLIDDSPRRMSALDLELLGSHLCSALHYLHGHGILHLDVKPDNVLNCGGLAKLIDLSLARPPGPCSPGMGTREYLAPEQARGEEVTTASDVWGVGATLFEAATRETPYAEHAAARRRGQRRYPQAWQRPRSVRTLRRLPGPLAEVIDACLEHAPGSRPTVREVAAVLDALLPDELR